jgi:hypothetical protein
LYEQSSLDPRSRARRSEPVAVMRRDDDEVLGPVRQIQTLALELAEQEQREDRDGDLEGAMSHRLDQLGWRLAAASRRAAHGGLGDAA